MPTSARLACGCPRAGQTSRAAGRYFVRRGTHLPSCSLGMHAHAEDRIILAFSGQFDSIYARRPFHLDTVRAIYRPAHVEHRDVYGEHTICLALLLPPDDGRRADAFPFVDKDLPLAAARVCAELDSRDPAADLVLESLVAEIAERASARRPLDGPRPAWLNRVREWIEDEYVDPPSLNRIAAEVDRQATHVATSFRREFGLSIGEYVRSVRLWRARPWVENPDMPLADVAHRHGFADQSHFSRLFKRRFGLTPGEYRRRGRSGGRREDLAQSTQRSRGR